MKRNLNKTKIQKQLIIYSFGNGAVGLVDMPLWSAPEAL